MKTPLAHELAAFGTHYLVPTRLLGWEHRARAVDVAGADRDPAPARELRRVFRLDLRDVEPPSWLGELTHLRVLKCCAPTLTSIPRSVLKLPMLRELYLERSGITELGDLGSSPSLRTVALRGTPIATDAAAFESALEGTGFAIEGTGFAPQMIERKPPPREVPGDDAELVRALHADAIHEDADLRGRDLSGATFEDGFFMQDFRGANLRGTVWKRCDLWVCQFEGADLTGAHFEDCFLDVDSRPAARVEAADVTFERCALRLCFTDSNLRGARFVDIEKNPRLRFSRTDARGMELTVTVTQENSISVDLTGADLRGARVVFDVVPERRAALVAKPNPRLKWAAVATADAKTDESTAIVYTPLPRKEPKPKTRK